MRCILTSCLLLTASAALAQTPVATAPDPLYNLHGQVTWIDQAHPSFTSPYSGPRSFSADSENARTFSSSLFLGVRPFSLVDIYVDPEYLQGHGLGNTSGIAGFPNGEAAKAAFPNLHFNLSRLYLQHTFNLGGAAADVPDGPNQIATHETERHLTVSVGKFAANDFFDGNTYSKDDRSQFMNWSLWESGAWDFPADGFGYTGGIVVEYFTADWALHYGLLMEPTAPNGSTLDARLSKAHGQVLQLDRSYTWLGHTGTVRGFGFWNQARMGNYADAMGNLSNGLVASRSYRSKAGFGLGWEQGLSDSLGCFSRVSWNDGHAESFAFAEIDRSVSVGLSLTGADWGRKNDVMAVAAVENGLSSSHRAYLAAGGTQGIFLGDGALSYGTEDILEAYYSFQATAAVSLSPDVQFISDPGYNRARGPVTVYAIRIHATF
jgi:high affinity Mn2+ porin